jgi:predicted adenine nucleotide alpha hydrolase (AANH) superfamily ATPase
MKKKTSKNLTAASRTSRRQHSQQTDEIGVQLMDTTDIIFRRKLEKRSDGQQSRQELRSGNHVC